MSWSSLPAGQDIRLVRGFYAVTAEVKNSHTEADVRGLIVSKGLSIIDYKDTVDLPGASPDSGYRFIAAQVWARSDAGSIPWAVPWWLPGDSSHLVRAWYAPPGSGTPTAPPPPPSEDSAWPWVLAFLGVSGALVWLFRRKKLNRVR